MMSFIGIIVVLFITYYGTRWLSAKANNLNKSKYMNVVDKIMLGQNKCMAIVEITNKYYLISITDSNISILKEIEHQDLTVNEDVVQAPMNMDFSKMLTKFIKNNKTDKTDKTD